MMELWKLMDPQCPFLHQLHDAQTYPYWIPVKQEIREGGPGCYKRVFSTTRFWADLMNHNRNKKAALSRLKTFLQDTLEDKGITYSMETKLELAEIGHDVALSLAFGYQKGSFEQWQYGTGGKN